MKVLKMSGLCLGISLSVVACGGNSKPRGDAFVPTSQALLNVQTAFLDDVAEAEIADRMARNCPGYEFNDTEKERVITKLSINTALLSGRRDVPAAELEKFQSSASDIMSNRYSRTVITEKIHENLDRLGITKRNYKQFCQVADEQYAKRTQLGRFLKKS